MSKKLDYHTNPYYIKMLEMRNNGMTLESISQAFGVTAERVRQITSRLGFVRKSRLSKEEIRQAKVKSKIESFWNNTKPNDDDCWEWIGTKTPLGYGRFRMRLVVGEEVYTHRISWILKNGPIPKGMNVLHKCDNPACCNYHHLYLGTQKENIKDREERFNHSLWKDRDKNKTPRRVAFKSGDET